MASPARADLRKDLFVPAASIAIGDADQDLIKNIGLAFTQVEVDLALNAAGQFRFTIPNAFDWSTGEFRTARGDLALPLLKLGTRVWIRFGYGDLHGQPLLLSGYIMAIATGFSEGGSPELEVSGQDAGWLMTFGTRDHRFEDKDVFSPVRKIASDYNLTARLIGTPPDKLPLDANMQKDLEFLVKLAANFSTDQQWAFYLRPTKTQDELHFRPRQIDAAPVGTLSWGVDLLSFKPEANLGGQVGRVVVHGWDELNKRELRGVAVARPKGNEVTPDRYLQQVSAIAAECHIRMPVKTQQEADQRAKAELDRISTQYVRGEGETFGFPELVPDTCIRIDGLGTMFSNTYYVTKAVHRYDASGYRTRFSIEDRMTPPSKPS